MLWKMQADKFKFRRQALKVSQGELSKLIDKHQTILSAWEKGRHEPRWSGFTAWEAALESLEAFSKGLEKADHVVQKAIFEVLLTKEETSTICAYSEVQSERLANQVSDMGIGFENSLEFDPLSYSYAEDMLDIIIKSNKENAAAYKGIAKRMKTKIALLSRKD